MFDALSATDTAPLRLAVGLECRFARLERLALLGETFRRASRPRPSTR